MTLDYLRNLGVSEDLAGYYARAGWLTRLARAGALCPTRAARFTSSLKILELRMPGCHIGGRTALAWHGIQHFLRPDSPLDLFGWNSVRLPDWFAKSFSASYRRKRLFAETPDSLLAVSSFGDAEATPLTSDPEHGLLEMLSEVVPARALPKHAPSWKVHTDCEKKYC